MSPISQTTRWRQDRKLRAASAVALTCPHHHGAGCSIAQSLLNRSDYSVQKFISVVAEEDDVRAQLQLTMVALLAMVGLCRQLTGQLQYYRLFSADINKGWQV